MEITLILMVTIVKTEWAELEDCKTEIRRINFCGDVLKFRKEVKDFRDYLTEKEQLELRCWGDIEYLIVNKSNCSLNEKFSFEWELKNLNLVEKDE